MNHKPQSLFVLFIVYCWTKRDLKLFPLITPFLCWHNDAKIHEIALPILSNGCLIIDEQSADDKQAGSRNLQN